MIDISRLPERPLVDSTILIAAWSERKDPARETCLSLLTELENRGSEMLIAAPTIAELLRGEHPIELPRRKSFVPVAFDTRAAELLGRDLPRSVLQRVKEESGRVYQYVKYDAMIAACAKRYGATCIISTDLHMPKLAKHLDLPCFVPEDYKLPLFKLREVKPY
jgi:predicted nucleic acid-binding protein